MKLVTFILFCFFVSVSSYTFNLKGCRPVGGPFYNCSYGELNCTSFEGCFDIYCNISNNYAAIIWNVVDFIDSEPGLNLAQREFSAALFSSIHVNENIFKSNSSRENVCQNELDCIFAMGYLQENSDGVIWWALSLGC